MFSITAEPECLIIFSLISLWYQKNCYLCFHISLGQKSWDPWRYLNAASHIQIRPEIWSMLVQNPNNPEDLRQSPHNLSRAYTKFGAGQKNPTQTNTQTPPPPNQQTQQYFVSSGVFSHGTLGLLSLPALIATSSSCSYLRFPSFLWHVYPIRWNASPVSQHLCGSDFVNCHPATSCRWLFIK